MLLGVVLFHFMSTALYPVECGKGHHRHYNIMYNPISLTRVKDTDAASVSPTLLAQPCHTLRTCLHLFENLFLLLGHQCALFIHPGAVETKKGIHFRMSTAVYMNT